MAKYLHSGRRRDICVLLADGDRNGQELKSRLEAHYDERIEPKAFYGSLSALREAGHVEKRTEGLHDVYSLTEAGRAALSDHYEWLADHVEAED